MIPLFSVRNYLVEKNRALEELVERRFKTFNQLWVYIPYPRPIFPPEPLHDVDNRIEIDSSEIVEMECVEYHTFEELLQKLQDMMYSTPKNKKGEFNYAINRRNAGEIF